MLLTITTTREPATDLGYLLHKHPDRVQSFPVSGGTAHVCYPEATPARCTAALLLEVDPIALVRAHRGAGADELGHYVNDRPYAASSLLAVAMKEVFRTALTGRCDARPELAAASLPLVIRVPALRCRGGAGLVRRVFGPLGWTVGAGGVPLDPPEWGDSAYLDVSLAGDLRLADALNHLYVLLPVLDDSKHYWVSTDEVDKLVRAGGDWLAGHPEKTLITAPTRSPRPTGGTAGGWTAWTACVSRRSRCWPPRELPTPDARTRGISRSPTGSPPPTPATLPAARLVVFPAPLPAAAS